jgi:hypothetical protein
MVLLLPDMGEMRLFKEVQRYSGICSSAIPAFVFIHWCYSNNFVFRVAEGNFVSSANPQGTITFYCYNCPPFL